jgi:phosphoglycerate dehydrogenase-like enzyme
MIIPVTALEYEKGRAVFEDAADYTFTPVEDNEQAIATFIRQHGCRAVVVGVTPYSGPLYEALPEGGLILRFGVGTDSLDRSQAQARGLTVANTPGALDRSVAEHTLFLMGALVRHVVSGCVALKAGSWLPETGDELQDLKLAVIGVGHIGAQVAKIAHLGFGMQTLACERFSEEATAARLGLSLETMQQHLGYTRWSSDPADILPEADIVSAHLPVVPGTMGYFDAARFRSFKRGSLFVNTARGALVVERDLAAALNAGHVAGAALDVYENEPYEPAGKDCDLRTFPNVIMTPHVASNTRAANRRMATMVVQNLRHWDAGALDHVHVVW